jgi:hypothetical protein
LCHAANSQNVHARRCRRIYGTGTTSTSMEDSCAVVCCGYWHILSPKTLLTFPAWLVRLPSRDGVYRYWWRSKRDFVRLSRALSREPSQMNTNTVCRIQTNLPRRHCKNWGRMHCGQGLDCPHTVRGSPTTIPRRRRTSIKFPRKRVSIKSIATSMPFLIPSKTRIIPLLHWLANGTIFVE